MPNTKAGTGTTKTDTGRMKQSANALVELRGDTENVDNTADEDTRAPSKASTNTPPPASRTQAPGPPCGSLMTMDVRWGEQVTHLKGMLQNISDRLHATTGEYTRAEQEEQARMASITSPFG